ncbi:diguanylate cyclase [Fusibacter bizertensis]|uniref:Diguanylate cyclase n=1 Tax=Fusibacter bizertensis TaxID=1488331 RepID=A0ABT6NEZ4_9FIRM|nr:diguanylate cyclase [Fusibacter bizertensis]MDH8678998.1 diguanylate cyclase [Fusibacter bizertensis]
MDSNLMYTMEKFRKTKLMTLILNPMNNLIIDINEEAAAFYGLAKSDLINKTYNSLSLDEEHYLRLQLLKSLEIEGHSFASKHRVITNQVKEIEVHTMTFETSQGRVILCLHIDRSEEKKIKSLLDISERKFKDLLENIPSVSVQGYRQDGTTFYWNKASESIYGYTREEAIGQSLLDLIIPNSIRAIVSKDIKSAFELGVPPEASELQLKHKNGSLVDVFSSHAILKLDDREPEMFCIDIDISERKIARQLRLAANVFTHAMEPILITDSDANIININEMFTETFGYVREEVLGENPRIIKSGIHGAEHYKMMWSSLISNGTWTGEVFNKTKNGKLIPMIIRINAVKDNNGNVESYICFFTDLTYIKQHQAELERAAYYDALTGLPNRTLLHKKMISAMKHYKNNKEKIAIVYLDLDGFKKINDSYGHDVGDLFLKSIAQNMQKQLREHDVLARLGGDEFVAVLVGFKSKDDCLHVVERLLDAAQNDVMIDKISMHVSASIGVAIFPDDANEPDLLMRLADKAMYLSKNSGKNKFVLHNG